jgi:aminoglycoside/choline kinase family phosphotransferase
VSAGAARPVPEPPGTPGDLDVRVAGYLADRGRLGRVHVQALSGDASTRRYFRIPGPEATTVLALYPEPFEAADLSFVVVRDLLAGWGLPVPQIVDSDGPRGILLLEDLGDVMLQDVLRTCSSDERAAYYVQAVEQIARLQREAARSPARAACFDLAFDVEKLDWELQHFLRHFVEGHRGAVLAEDERAALLAELRALAAEIASWPRVLCHRDYHSRNLMVRGGDLVWVDFQDARMGPATYDLVSLLRDAYVELSEQEIARLADGFRRTALPEEPAAVFERRFDWMGVQRNLKALGTFGYMDTMRGNPVYLQYVPRTLAHARRNLERHPELAALRSLLARHIEELR